MNIRGEKLAKISIKKAALINATAKYSTTIMNLLFNAILARILSPEDYGVVVVTFVFITFFSIIADLGLGSALIQNKDLTKDDVNNLFTFTFRLSILLAIGFSVLSFPISIFYKNDVYIPIGIILSVAIIFNTLNMIPNAMLMKEKRFVLVAVRTFVIAVCGSILAIILALCGLKYYALVFQSVFVGIITFFWNYAYTKPKLKRKYDRTSIEKVRNFSLYQFKFNVINYFARNTDNLLIGKFMGEAALGYYDKAYKLMLLPAQNLSHVISPVLHPILSDYQNNRVYIYQKYMKIVKILSLVGILISAICFLSAEEIVLIMFGQQWEASIPAFRILSLSVWAQIVTSSTGAIFQSLGNTKIMFQAGSISAMITVSCILIGLFIGDLVYLSMLVAIGFNCSFIVNFMFLILKGFKLSFFDFIKRFIPDMVIIFVMALTISVYQFDISNVFISLIMKMIIVTSFFILSLILTKQYKILTVLFVKRRKNDKFAGNFKKGNSKNQTNVL